MTKYFSRRYLLLFALALSTLLVTGCQGCRDDVEKTAEQKKTEEEEKKEREKPTYETESAVIYPGQYSEVVKNNRTKRGHWVTADFRIIANKFDTQGELQATSCTGTVPARPVVVESTDYFAVSSRPFSIPKEEMRNLETNIYVPRREGRTSSNIKFDLFRGAGGLTLFSVIHGSTTMSPHQYHMVVLTNRPDAYQYLNLIDSVRVPETSETGGNVPTFYTVVRTRPSEEPIALPRQSLYWTTIAYLIWDDLNVDQLDAEQQQALIDWIHFGGQLILSGPDCLDQLSDSFLAEYLPAVSSRTKNLDADDFKAVNENWAVKIKHQNRRQEIVVSDKAPVLGVEFDPHPDAQFVKGTGEIAIERQVGRGRIVATAFSMDDKPIIRWPGYRNLFNGCLLRRPGRKFGKTSDGTVSFTWTADATSIFDPLLGSTLRYLSRDLVSNFDPTFSVQRRGTPSDPDIKLEQFSSETLYELDTSDNVRYRPEFASSKEVRNLEDHWHYGGFQHDVKSGTAGWNDYSGVSTAARATLKRAAGISPPSAGFVLRLLAVYLIVLVPVNWLVFRMMGRVEWAWIAAPFIAIGGAFMVARMASLDIGFVRSNSQVSCVEIYADYPRAHVAQYSALYTSLSTGYDLDLDNPSAQALPLGRELSKRGEKSVSPVIFRKTINNRLEDLQVQSNTTGMLHTEMMLDLQGVFSLNESDQQIRVENGTMLELTDAAIVRSTAENDLEAAWIGNLAAGTFSSDLKFENVTDLLEPWRESKDLMSGMVADNWWRMLTEESTNMELSRVAVSVIRERVPEIAARWDEFVQLLARKLSDTAPDQLFETELTYPIFRDVVLEMKESDQINVSAIFQVVAGNLELAPGETRLIAITNQPIGNNRLTPRSTQSQQQSLVVVHLKRPPLPTVNGDTNATEDFFSRSDQDWLAEQADFYESADERAGELEKDE